MIKSNRAVDTNAIKNTLSNINARNRSNANRSRSNINASRALYQKIIGHTSNV